MTDLILQIAATKLAASVVLAGLAWALTRRFARPALSHALWLLLLGALLVPPLVSIPVFAAGVEPATAFLVATPYEASAMTPPAPTLTGWLLDHWKLALVLAWVGGAAGLVGWSLIRALRFHRHLLGASAAAPSAVRQMARDIAETLGLASTPAINVTRSHVAPLVWWAGGQPSVYFPEVLLNELDGEEVRCILAHELAHVCRRDHLVRWLEWLACSVFWWNPVAWWARRRLRADEELCCDCLVMSSIAVEPRVYAGSLLRGIEHLSATPALRAPGFASAADGGEHPTLLEERLRMILRDRPASVPDWLRGIVRAVSIAVLAASLVYCTDRADPMAVEAATVPAVEQSEDAPSHNAGAPWPEGGSGEQPRLDVVGPELDSPWSRRVADGVLVHLDSLVDEGSDGPNVEAFEAATQGRRLPAGAPHYFLMLSRADGGCCDPYVIQFKNRSIPFESLIVDLARLRDKFTGSGISLSQKDLEAVIRRSTSMKDAGWNFVSMAGFSGPALR